MYLTYSPTTDKYPSRVFINPNSIKNSDIPDVVVELAYSSNGDTNGLFYYYGTTGLTTLFANPVPSTISVSQTGGATDPNQQVVNVTDRVNNGGNAYYAGGGNGWTIIYTLPKAFTLTKMSVRVGQSYATSSITVYGSNDGSSWTSLGTFSQSTGSNAWTLSNVNDSSSYTRFKFVSNSGYATLDEMELYGTLIL